MPPSAHGAFCKPSARATKLSPRRTTWACSKLERQPEVTEPMIERPHRRMLHRVMAEEHFLTPAGRDRGLGGHPRDGFQRHVAGALDGSFIVLSSRIVPIRRTMAVFIGGDANDLGPALDLTVEALERVGRVQLGPVLRREHHIGQRIGLGLIEEAGKLEQLGAELVVGDLPTLRSCGFRIVLGQRRLRGRQRGHVVRSCRRASTRQRCQLALSTLAAVALMPSRASDTTSLTPRRPRRASLRRKPSRRSQPPRGQCPCRELRAGHHC
ncbi:hypothetical protein ACVILK_003218 [Bradyrhizobium embrapense]